MPVMAVTTGLWWGGAVSGAPGLGLRLAISGSSVPVWLAPASVGSLLRLLIFILGCVEGCHLRLVFRVESCLGLIEIN